MQDAVQKIAVAESNAMRESRAKAEAERKLAQAEHQTNTLQTDIDQLQQQILKLQVLLCF